MRRLLPLPLLLLALGGCADLGDPPVAPDGGEPPVSYAADLQPVWNAHCTGCHGAGGAGGLDLRAPDGRANLAGVTSPSYAAPRVAPGDPDGSVLFAKLADTGAYGPLMPQGGPALPADTIEQVRRWIADGALDN